MKSLPLPGALSDLIVSCSWDNADRWDIFMSWKGGFPPFQWSFEAIGSSTDKQNGTTSDQRWYGTFHVDGNHDMSARVIAAVSDSTGAKLTSDETYTM